MYIVDTSNYIWKCVSRDIKIDLKSADKTKIKPACSAIACSVQIRDGRMCAYIIEIYG